MFLFLFSAEFVLPLWGLICYNTSIYLNSTIFFISGSSPIFQDGNISRRTYLDLGKVITIVVIESSSGEFHEAGDHYIHHFKQTSDTDLKLNLLQEYIFIALDVFRKITHNNNISTELEAWMCFLSSDNPSDILKLTEAYPYFKELYSDIIKFQRKPKELVTMFSEALEIMDRNTIKYMIESRDEKIRQKDQELARKDSELRCKDMKIEDQAVKIEDQSRVIAELMQRVESLEEKIKQ